MLSLFSRQSLSRMSASASEIWNGLTTRWRRNPGFVTAAAAGSIGLALAVLLGIQGALRLFDPDPTAGTLEDEFTNAVLNDPDDFGDEFPPVLRELRAESGA